LRELERSEPKMIPFSMEGQEKRWRDWKEEEGDDIN
jgi:hypothetical protein